MTVFVTRFTNKKSFCISCLRVADNVAGPAWLVCCMQLQTRAWFLDVASCTAVASVAAPNFNRAWRLTTAGNMSWLPAVPLSHQSPKTGTGGPGAAGINKNKKKPKQVCDAIPSTDFEDFKTRITKAKFNEVIKKVGSPPKVKRDGKDINMCILWHLRGLCNSNCPHKADHGTHTKEDDDTLCVWCQKAFA